MTLHDVALSYPGRPRLFRASTPLQILHPLSLSVAHGEFLGIVGESGSGKTSLARLIAGMIPPTSGRIAYAASTGTPAPRPCGFRWRTRAMCNWCFRTRIRR